MNKKPLKKYPFAIEKNSTFSAFLKRQDGREAVFNLTDKEATEDQKEALSNMVTSEDEKDVYMGIMAAKTLKADSKSKQYE